MAGFDRSKLGAGFNRSLDDAAGRSGDAREHARRRRYVGADRRAQGRRIFHRHHRESDGGDRRRSATSARMCASCASRSPSRPSCSARNSPARSVRPGAQGFSAGAFGAEVHRAFVRLGAMQEAQAQIFAKNATPGPDRGGAGRAQGSGGGRGCPHARGRHRGAVRRRGGGEGERRAVVRCRHPQYRPAQDGRGPARRRFPEPVAQRLRSGPLGLLERGADLPRAAGDHGRARGRASRSRSRGRSRTSWSP